MIFVESAFTLIIGGAYGSLLSSASFHGLERFLKRRYFKKMESMEQTGEEKNEREAVKREVKIGKRFVVLGAFLLLESILIALLFMQVLPRYSLCFFLVLYNCIRCPTCDVARIGKILSEHFLSLMT
ncbi:MAG: hypothetical protein ACUVQ5_06375 [Candidatus Methanomethylicaceae archaeon]